MMNDDQAKQSSDNISGQKMAREEDLHHDLLHASNPAFHTLSAMGLKGSIKADIIKKPDTEGIVEDSQAKKTIKEETVSSGKNKQVKEADLSAGELSHFSQWLSTLVTPVLPEYSEPNVGEEINVPKPEGMIHPAVRQETVDVQLQDRTETDSALEKHKRKKKKRAKKNKMKKKERRRYDSGVVLSDDIFSETLADLLASQGHYKQAIHMYEKMRLIYPEKSRFFAAKIEALNKKE
jgi:hypothetical protein